MLPRRIVRATNLRLDHDDRTFALITITGPTEPTAYCDESYVGAKGQSDRLFVLASYVAPLKQWEYLNPIWERILHDEGMKIQGSPLREFKASDCHGGKGIFEGWERHDRERVWHRLIRVLTECNVLAVWLAIDLDAYSDHVDVIKAHRPPGFEKAYVLAFQSLIHVICQEYPDSGDPITLVFDEIQKQGNAKIVYDKLKSSDFSYKDRLHSLTFAESHLVPGLQAADILAYEILRHVREVDLSDPPKPDRWQWQRLSAKGLMRGNYINRGGVEVYRGWLTGK